MAKRTATKKTPAKKPRHDGATTRRDVTGVNYKLVLHAHWISELRTKLAALEARVNGLSPTVPADQSGAAIAE